MQFEAILEEIPRLSLEQRKQLVTFIFDSIADEVNSRDRSLLEFEGAGAALRDETDAQAYVNQLRAEWDDRP